MNSPLAVVLFRDDLRLVDHPALSAAQATGLPVLLLFLQQPHPSQLESKERLLGTSARWWQRESVFQLREAFRKRYAATLHIGQGPPDQVLCQLHHVVPIHSVHLSARHTHSQRSEDERLKQRLAQIGIQTEFYPGQLFFAPEELLKENGTPYQVFTPFYRNCRRALGVDPQVEHKPGQQTSRTQKGKRTKTAQKPQVELRRALPPPSHLYDAAVQGWSPTLQQRFQSVLGPGFDEQAFASRGERLRRYWQPGAEQAIRAWERFLEEDLRLYAELRDSPHVKGTSGLSAPLRFGELSPILLWESLKELQTTGLKLPWDRFLAQLCWREFSHTLAYFHENIESEPLRKEFLDFPWENNDEHWALWTSGKTGFTLVDAGMAELQESGWMHNRVRMITASFLVKDLFLPWQMGENWFWEHLVDACPANNPVSWQWVAGCGVDATPFFRIFNPDAQAGRYDPHSIYRQRWLGTASTQQSSQEARPSPCVHHDWQRARALRAYTAFRAHCKSPSR